MADAFSEKLQVIFVLLNHAVKKDKCSAGIH